jgi:hypothetical protein
MLTESLKKVQGHSSHFPLLPALKSLTWQLHTSFHTTFLCHLISCQLHTLSLDFEEYFALWSFGELTAVLASVCPPISKLGLNMPGFNTFRLLDEIAEWILPLFTLPSTIKQLTLDSSTFVHCLLDILPALTEITELELSGQAPMPPETTISELTSRKDRIPVKTIRGAGICPGISLLPLTSRMVESITLGGDNRTETTADEIRHLFEVIGQSCPCLRELRLLEIDLEPEPEDLQGIFVPLLQCVQMEELCIGESSFDFSYSVVNSDITSMARAWKHLHTLMLNSDTDEREAHPPLTLQAIASLKGHCPQLRYLGLTINAAIRVFPDRLPPAQVLLHIELGHSRIGNTREIAFWLHPICDDIGWPETCSDDQESSFFDLDDLLSILHSSASKLSLSKDRIIDSLKEENMRLKERLTEMEAETGR